MGGWRATSCGILNAKVEYLNGCQGFEGISVAKVIPEYVRNSTYLYSHSQSDHQDMSWNEQCYSWANKLM